MLGSRARPRGSTRPGCCSATLESLALSKPRAGSGSTPTSCEAAASKINRRPLAGSKLIPWGFCSPNREARIRVIVAGFGRPSAPALITINSWLVGSNKNRLLVRLSKAMLSGLVTAVARLTEPSRSAKGEIRRISAG